MKVKAGPSKEDIWLRAPTFLFRHQLWSNGSGRYIIMRTVLRDSRFPDDVDRDGPRNVGLLAFHPPDAAATQVVAY